MQLSITINVRRTASHQELSECISSLFPILGAVAAEIRVCGGKDMSVPAEYAEKISFCGRRQRRTADAVFSMEIPSDLVFENSEVIAGFLSSGECEDYDRAAFTVCGGREEYFRAAVIKNGSDGIRTKLLDCFAVKYGEDVPEKHALSSLRYLGYAMERRGTDSLLCCAYINTGLYLCPEERRREKIPFIAEKMKLFLSEERFEEACGLCGEYFSLGAEDLPADVQMLYGKLCALEKLGLYGEADETCREYLRLVRKLTASPVTDTSLLRCDAADTDKAAAAACRTAGRLLDYGDTAGAVRILDDSPSAGIPADILGSLLECELRLCRASGFERAETVFRRLRKKDRPAFAEMIRKELARSADKDGFSEQLSEMFFDEPFIEDIITIYRMHYSGSAEAAEKKYKLSQCPELLYFALAEGRDIEGLISEDLEASAKAVDRIFEDFPEAPGLFSGYDPAAGKEPKELFALAVCFERAAVGSVMFGDADLTAGLFEMYCGYGFRFACICFGEEVCSDGGSTEDIPPGICRYIYGGRAAAALSEHRWLDSIRALREMLKISPASAVMIGAYNEKLRRVRNRIENNIRIAEAEMYSASIKENIRFFLSHGDIVHARGVLTEYMKLEPLDSDIPRLLAEAGLVPPGSGYVQ